MAEQDPTAERWLPVVGYEGLYEVSSFGRVRSLDGAKANGHPRHGKVISTPLSMGYPCFNLCREGSQVQVRVHRIVAEAFLGPSPDGSETVNHKNFDRTDNRPENLEWLSHGDNMRHAHATGRCAANRVYTSGEDYRRLAPETVREIRRMYSAGFRITQLAHRFGISRPHVSRIVHGKVWKNL